MRYRNITVLYSAAKEECTELRKHLGIRDRLIAEQARAMEEGEGKLEELVRVGKEQATMNEYLMMLLEDATSERNKDAKTWKAGGRRGFSEPAGRKGAKGSRPYWW